VGERLTVILSAVILIAALGAGPAHAADAKGTVAYKGRTVDVKHAFLVQTTDAMSGKPMRRLILSPKDIGPKIASCAKMSCVDGDLDEGLEVDLVEGPRVNYWLVMNGQKVQYSGTEPRESLSATSDDAKKVAGTLRFDKTAAGGPKVDVTFDATLVKALQ